MIGFADLHIHTIYSWDGTCTPSAVLKYVTDHTDLSIIAITDHNEIRGALMARELALAYEIQVITGSEVTTSEGHLLALYIEDRIPPGKSLLETVLLVGEQGGVCVIPHPAESDKNSIKPASVRNVLEHPDAARVLVGVETQNSGFFHKFGPSLGEEISQDLGLSPTGSSDAHILEMIGQSATQFPGTTAAEFRQALLQGTTCPVASRLESRLSMVKRWLPRFLLRAAGWVIWSPTPRLPLRFAHVSQIIHGQRQFETVRERALFNRSL